ncbi:unnamed protein product [Nezara viridula]|uniref:Metaxin-2 n=1 Tax=Nezara viridula TaxID=85310 RepID=A0A9P0MSP5_NEZVI|nr:unnamed protein product [Nezara viridula]
MPSVLTTDSFNCELGGKEPWPDDVKLYQPYETEQILLPDMANCLAVQAFLKMCQLDFTVQYKANAEDMSPSGRVPFIKCGACLVSDLEPITNFVASKGVSLTDHLDPAQRSDMRTYMSLVNTVLGNAENYITWVENETYSNVTKPRYGSVHPFPLNHILSFLKRQSVTKRLNALGWYRKSLDKVYEEVERACNALSERLGKERFFFGENPTELDALVFGNIFSILTVPGFPPGLKLADIVRNNKTLMRHCRQIMNLVAIKDNIENPVLHKAFIRQNAQKEAVGDSDLDEFVYEESDDEDKLWKDETTQQIQDYSCLVNDENMIYDSLFGKTPQDMELGAISDPESQLY